MITKISTIKNLAVFRDFDWDSTVLGSDNKPVSFARLNIIYGRNYSGKTTLSRILQALETGDISDKYENPEFKVEFEGGSTVDNTAPKAHSHQVRVFNEDFVRTNLKVFFNDDEAIESFAVLGKQNVEDAEKLKVKQAELGSVDKPGPLLITETDAKTEWSLAKGKFKDAFDSLETQLREKANAKPNGIKHVFSELNYNISHLKSDIETVQRRTYKVLTDEKVKNKSTLWKEPTKAKISEGKPLSLKYSSLISEAEELLQRVINVSEPIQELLAKALLQEWVRKGRELHEGVRKTCGFCGNLLPDDLKGKLDKHFNKESEELRKAITFLMSKIYEEISDSSSFISVDIHAFYSTYMERAQALEAIREASLREYQSALQKVYDALSKRQEDIYNIHSLPELPDASLAMKETSRLHNKLISESNNFTKTLMKEQNKACNSLRLHEILNFISTIKFDDLKKNITSLETAAQKKKKEVDDASKIVETTHKEIDVLEAGMRDEKNGVIQVNNHLNHFFGHPALSLEAVKNDEGVKSDYSFEIQRNGKRAYNLSEGERSLIAFCYFIARLEDVSTSGKTPIVLIDDPVSSLDDNHVFFIYSMINTYIAQPDSYHQLFISTHNLSFLKYLKRLPGKREHFIVHRKFSDSTIQKMPTHLELYATEFHYLFHQICMCANADETDESVADTFYNFGNNVRKFLEMYLYFRYPNANREDKTKLLRFLGSDRIATSLTERIDNEYSHLLGIFERGMKPIDVPEMKAMAEFLRNRMSEVDPDQYEALLESIGEVAAEPG